MAEIRPNRAKRKLKAGLPVLAPTFAPATSIPDNDILDYLASQGTFDVAWVEMEHGPFTWRDLSDISRVCDLWGVTSLVRTNLNDPAIIGRTLDRGIQSVLVPHVSSRNEAERVVAGAYYSPIGARGISAPRQSYGVEDYYQKANDEILTVILLEEMEAIRNLEEILQVKDIDVLFLAPYDLAQTMGPEYVGKPFHPDVQDVVRKSLQTIRAAGRISGTYVEEGNVKEFMDLGVQFLRYPAHTYLIEGLKKFEKIVSRAVAK